MHFYTHHIGDYNRDTPYLSLVEHGAYRVLMDLYYVAERPLKANMDLLCRVCKCNSEIERDAVALVVENFFVERDGLLFHKRIDGEIENYKRHAELSAQAGRRSGEVRRAKKTPSIQTNAPSNGKRTTVHDPLNGNANETQTNVELTINHKPLTNNKEEAALLPFGSEEFRKTWSDWKTHRKEKRQKLTPSTEISQLKKLSEMGESRAIAALRNSIEKGYQGIFESKESTSQPQRSSGGHYGKIIGEQRPDGTYIGAPTQY